MSLSCTQMEQMVGCLRKADGTTQAIIIHTEYAKDAAGNTIVHRVIYADSTGAPLVLAVGDTVTPGCCAATDVAIVGDGVQIAGPARAALTAFFGAANTWDTSAVPGKLHSITVAAKSVQDGLPGTMPDFVIVALPGGNKIALMDGEVRTFSVARDFDAELKREYSFEASGMAYATITYTFW